MLKSLFKVFSLTTLGCILFLSNILLATAVSGGPGKEVVSVQPGETYEGIVYVKNSEDIPRIGVITQVDLSINESGAFDYNKEPLLKGLIQWTNFSGETEKLLDPEERYQVRYTVTVPEDADPGTYSSGFLISAKPPQEAEDAQVYIGGQVLSQLFLTVEGDFDESLSLKSFELNEKSFLKGDVTFDISLENLGNVMLQPKGNITIFSENGEQLDGIYPIVKTFDDEEVVTDRKNAIPINFSNIVIQPEAAKNMQIAWTHRKADLGKYKAKLQLFYGQGDQELNAEIDFELLENFNISNLEADSYFNGSLPVNFSTRLQNIGNLPVTPKGYFAITNIFGSQKMRIDFREDELNLKGGEEKLLDNITWNNGFALGYYKASINIDVNGQSLSESVGLWVISWWQAIILIVVLLLVVFGFYKGIHGYLQMKKKLESAKEKEE